MRSKNHLLYIFRIGFIIHFIICTHLKTKLSLFLLGVDLLHASNSLSKLGELFPRSRQLKLSKLLRQLKRLYHYSLLLIIIPHLSNPKL